MQLRSPNHKTRIIEMHGGKIAGVFRLGVPAALLISLVYVTNAIWQPDAVVAQGVTETQLGVALSANQEVPTVTSPSTAKGVGNVTVSADQTTINYSLTLTGPFTSDPVQAHIHAGRPGVAGPVIFFICSAAQEGVQACPLAAGGEISGTLTEAEFMPRPEAGIETFADAVAAITGGNAYLNVHTTANASGEIRGQIGPVSLGALLSSAAEIPPVTTPSSATGTAAVAIAPDHASINYTLTLTGPFTGDPAQAHIHAGSPEVAGPVIFLLCAASFAVVLTLGGGPSVSVASVASSRE